MKRQTQILTIILILQIGLTAIVFWPRTATAPESGAALLADLSSEAIREIRIEDGEGAQIVIAKTEAGWVLPEVDAYPVLELRVVELIGKLAVIRTDRLITTTESSHRRLKVAADDFERKIVLVSGEDDAVTLFVGTSPSYGSAHVRLDGEDETYLTSELSSNTVSAEASSWVNTSFLSVPAAEIQAMRLENAHGEWAFEKDEEGTWVLQGLAEGEATNVSAVNGIESRVSELNMREPLGVERVPDYGMGIPSAYLEIDTPEKTITLLAGVHDSEGGTYVVQSSESAYYVRVSDFLLTSLVDSTQEDFVITEPTPTPQLEGAEPTPEATAAE